MEETAWDTALAPHPAGCCKDRVAARPDPCDGRGVGHLFRGPAGSGGIGIGLGAEVPGGVGLDRSEWTTLILHLPAEKMLSVGTLLTAE